MYVAFEQASVGGALLIRSDDSIFRNILFFLMSFTLTPMRPIIAHDDAMMYFFYSSVSILVSDL